MHPSQYFNKQVGMILIPELPDVITQIIILYHCKTIEIPRYNTCQSHGFISFKRFLLFSNLIYCTFKRMFHRQNFSYQL